MVVQWWGGVGWVVSWIWVFPEVLVLHHLTMTIDLGKWGSVYRWWCDTCVWVRMHHIRRAHSRIKKNESIPPHVPIIPFTIQPHQVRHMYLRTATGHGDYQTLPPLPGRRCCLRPRLLEDASVVRVMRRVQ